MTPWRGQIWKQSSFMVYFLHLVMQISAGRGILQECPFLPRKKDKYEINHLLRCPLSPLTMDQNCFSSLRALKSLLCPGWMVQLALLSLCCSKSMQISKPLRGLGWKSPQTIKFQPFPALPRPPCL